MMVQHLVNPACGDLKGRWQACHACMLCTCWLLLAASSKALQERDKPRQKIMRKKKWDKENPEIGDLQRRKIQGPYTVYEKTEKF